MTLLFGSLILVMMFSLNIYKDKGINENYLSKDTTLAIKGIFIMLVFLSHARSYVDFNFITDTYVIQFLNMVGQLMVTLFLFYSGYGIYESIKRKDMKYVDSLPVNRIGKTFFDFSIAIFLFILLNIFLNKKLVLSNVLLSFTGWSSIGNSNWYMFAIFTLYILTYVSFKLFGKNKFISICCMTVLSFGYVYVMSKLKPNVFSNTYLCYMAGMWYSYFKDVINKILNKHMVLYYVLFVVLLGLFIYLYPDRHHHLMYHNAVCIFFSLSVILLSMKITFNSKILIWLGKNLFWIYILQRIPMMILVHYGVADFSPLLFILVSFVVTLFMSKYMMILSNKLKSYIFS